MSNADVSRAANSAVDAAAGGLDRYYQAIIERVIALLAKDRDSFTKTLEDGQTMLGAVATELHEIGAEGKRGRTELMSGVHGLAQDLSVLAAALAHFEKRFVEVEKTVMALKKGQAASDEQSKKVLQDIAELREEIAALREAAKETARIAKEHAQFTEHAAELDRRLAQIEAWKAELEARADGR